jgi:hypothetical protein
VRRRSLHRAGAGAAAQGRIAVADPLRPCRHGDEELARTVELVFGLDGAAIELGLAENPAVVGGNQEFLDQELGVRVGEIGSGYCCAGVEAGEERRHLVAPRSQLARALIPLAVLHTEVGTSSRPCSTT